MSGLNSFHRGAAAAGASALIALSLVAPAQARPDPGPTVRQQTTNSYEGDTARLVVPPPVQVIRVNDSGAQYLQLGGGLVAGLALGGAGMVLVSRRSHAHPRLA